MESTRVTTTSPFVLLLVLAASIAVAVVSVGGTVRAQIRLPDKLAGVYTVDAHGKGDRCFTDLSTALRYASLVGVDGECTIEVRPGDYRGPLLLYPIPGLGEGKKFVVRGVGDGARRLTAEGSIVEFLDGCKDVVLDGLEFGDAGPQAAIRARGRVTDIEIRNCRFGGTGSRVFEIDGQSQARRWEIHHNRFDLGPSFQYGIYTQSTFQLDIHDNEFVCDGCNEPISIWNANKSESKLQRNVFRGSVRDCCVRLDVSGHDVDVCDNVFLLDLRNGQSSVVRSQGLQNVAYNRVRHNVFVVRGTGNAVRTAGPIALDHNLYAMEEGGIGVTGNDVQETLSAWQENLASYAVDAHADQHAATAEPKFFARYAPLLALLHDFASAAEAESAVGTAPAAKPATTIGGTRAAATPKDEIQYLITVLAASDPVAQRLAMLRLATHGPRAAPAVASLGRLCASPHAAVRAAAATCLGSIRIGAEIVVPELVKLLGDDDEWVLLATIRTLGSFRHLAAEAVVRLQTLGRHELESVRNAAQSALAQIAPDRPAAPRDGAARDGKSDAARDGKDGDR